MRGITDVAEPIVAGMRIVEAAKEGVEPHDSLNKNKLKPD
jgi:hypothetical protein